MLLLKLLLLTVVKNKSMKHEKMNGAKVSCYLLLHKNPLVVENYKTYDFMTRGLILQMTRPADNSNNCCQASLIWQ